MLNRLLDPQKFIDPDTGELYSIETIMLKSGEFLAQMKGGEQKSSGRRPRHVMLKKNKRALEKLFRLSDTEYRLFTMLCLFVGWESNIVMGDGVYAGEKNEPLTWPDVDALLNMDRRTRYKIQKKLEDGRYIGYLKVDGKCRGIVIHPDFVQFGRKISKDCLAVFETTKTVERDTD